MIPKDKHDKWKRWLEAVETDFINLDRTHMLWSRLQYVFWEDGNLPHWGYWAKYFLDTYATTAMSAVRRQIRHNRDSISLAGLLTDISDAADTLDYPWWSTFKTEGNENYWNNYYGRPDAIRQTVAKHMAAMQRFVHLLEVADKRLAHWDKREPVQSASTDDITRVILALHEILDWVHPLIVGARRPFGYDFEDVPVEEVFNVVWKRSMEEM